MALKDEILKYLDAFPGATDSDLEKALGKNHQHINMVCRNMVKQGLIIRQRNSANSGRIGNYPTGKIIENPILEKSKESTDGEPLQEEEIKHILYDYLTKDGWSVTVAWGHLPGVDIDARKHGERWLIEVKGPGSRQPMRANYFQSILGETLQRMDDPDARYSIAFPDMNQYRRLWDKLPQLAKERTTIDLLLIGSDGSIKTYQ